MRFSLDKLIPYSFFYCLEEIFADQYAGINRSSSGARQAVEAAGDVAQPFAGDIENARQNRAGIERRNGPGTRLSVDDFDRQFLNDTEMFDTIAFLVDEMI